MIMIKYIICSIKGLAFLINEFGPIEAIIVIVSIASLLFFAIEFIIIIIDSIYKMLFRRRK